MSDISLPKGEYFPQSTPSLPENEKEEQVRDVPHNLAAQVKSAHPAEQIHSEQLQGKGGVASFTQQEAQERSEDIHQNSFNLDTAQNLGNILLSMNKAELASLFCALLKDASLEQRSLVCKNLAGGKETELAKRYEKLISENAIDAFAKELPDVSQLSTFFQKGFLENPSLLQQFNQTAFK